MPKLKNSNATFWVIFKHCEFVKVLQFETKMTKINHQQRRKIRKIFWPIFNLTNSKKIFQNWNKKHEKFQRKFSRIFVNWKYIFFFFFFWKKLFLHCIISLIKYLFVVVFVIVNFFKYTCDNYISFGFKKVWDFCGLLYNFLESRKFEVD